MLNKALMYAVDSCPFIMQASIFIKYLFAKYANQIFQHIKLGLNIEKNKKELYKSYRNNESRVELCIAQF